jgi:hypothetical protein
MWVSPTFADFRVSPTFVPDEPIRQWLGRSLERQGLLVRDLDSSYLALDPEVPIEDTHHLTGPFNNRAMGCSRPTGPGRGHPQSPGSNGLLMCWCVSRNSVISISSYSKP